ncbi:MAG: signal peptidase I [Acidimicrobiales bacterium]
MNDPESASGVDPETDTGTLADDQPLDVEEGWILESEDSIRAEAKAFGEERRGRRKVLRLHVLSWIAIAAGAIGLGLLIRTFVVQTFYVPSGSMEPTLLVGDRILVDKLPVVSHDIQRGDIIVFQRVARDTDPTKPADLVKRVIGMPGETISSRGDTVLINGKPLAEPWLPDLRKVPRILGCYAANLDIPRTLIPQGQYYVLGDCRGNSSDSRVWGPVPSSHIVGKVFLVVWRNGHPWFHWF